ncbi:hypothetical protein XENOCAPTIV_028687 [Xenoophorus captivus]|uniref:HARP domain-containing protein n=1 Tax=Xenoophorus captivus TaxID=1517983 RepID=A0ABV0R2Z0_9TELE
MSNQLTAEQQRKIEENRRKALERRAQRLGQQPPAGCNGASAQADLSKQSKNHRNPPFSAPPRFVPPFKKDSPMSSNQIDRTNYQLQPAGSFYKPAGKPGQVSAVQPPSSANTSAAPKKAAISVRGKCVPHAENRFKVEVGYHAELIAVFKSIPSKNYVDQAASIPSVSLRPVEGIGALDSAAAPSRPCDGAVLAALLKLCNGWQKPAATLRGQCILVSRTKFEVDILYHADVIATFKQMPTKNYGRIAFSLISVFPNDLGSKCFLIAQYIADMTTRKWSFSLEDYKRLMDLLSGIAGVQVEPLPRPVIQAFAARFDGSEAKSLDVPEADLSSIDPTLTSSLMPFQKEGVKRWLPSLSPGSINVVVKAKDDMQSGLVNIVSYDLLSRMDKQHPGHSFYVLIMVSCY